MDIDLGILKNIFTKKEDIKNNLTSTDTDKPLSAAQGKELQRQINNITSGETPTDHNHDDRYYTESEINTLLEDKVNISDIDSVNATITYDDDTTDTIALVILK